MKNQYTAILHHDSNNQITKITCPILFNQLPVYTREEENSPAAIYLPNPWDEGGLTNFLQKKIVERLVFLKENSYVVPLSDKNRSYDEYLSKTDIPVSIYVDFDFEKGRFQTNLPRFAVVIGTLSAISYGLSSVLAFELASGSKDNDRSKTLSIVAAVFGTIMDLVIFVYSDAIRHSAETGRTMDDYFFKKQMDMSASMPISEESLIANPKLRQIEICSHLFFSFLTVGNSVFKMIALYQTTISLAQLANEENKAIIPQNAIMPMAILIAIIQGVSVGLFEAGFAIDASKHVVAKVKTSNFFKREIGYQNILTEPNETDIETKNIDSPNGNECLDNYYVVILHYDGNNQIIKIMCPTLFGPSSIYARENKNYLTDVHCSNPWDEDGLRKYIHAKLLEKLIFLKTNGYIIPHSGQEKCYDSQLNQAEIAMPIHVDFSFEKGVFQISSLRFMVVLGVLSAISFGLKSVLALELTSASKDNDGAQLFAIVAATFSAVMYFIMFVYSEAMHHSEEMGNKVDDYFFRKKMDGLDVTLATNDPSDTNSKTDSVEISSYLFFSILTTGDVACTIIAYYLTIVSLGYLAIEKNSAVIPENAILPTAIAMTITYGISVGMFEAGFAVAAGKHVSESIKATCYFKKTNHRETIWRQQPSISPIHHEHNLENEFLELSMR